MQLVVDGVTKILKDAGFTHFVDRQYPDFAHGFAVSELGDSGLAVTVQYESVADGRTEYLWATPEERAILLAMAAVLTDASLDYDGQRYIFSVALTMNFGSWRELWVNAIPVAAG